jgi:PAS domain S-box-containing protein
MNQTLDEKKRLEELQEYGVLDTQAELEFDALTSIASQICAVPVAVINLVDAERVWFKSKVGIKELEMPRDQSFCNETLKQKKIVLVEDLTQDPRFSSMPLVLQDPKYRFYAGAPLINPRGHILGTLCLLDVKPRSLTEKQQAALLELSHLVTSQLEMRRNLRHLEATLSEKGRIEQELRSSRQEYKHIIDSANELIYRTDENGIITFFNPAATRLLKFNQDELINHHYTELVHPAYRRSVERFYGLQYFKKTPVTYREIPGMTKDGSIVWLGQSVQLLFQQEHVMGFSVVARDITEKKQIEERVAESERRLLAIVNTVNEGITLCDEQGHFEVFNPRMEELTGYSMADANQNLDFNRVLSFGEDTYRRMLSRQKELWDTGNVQDLEIAIRTKSGEKKIFLLSSSLVKYNSRKMMLSGYRDVTEHRRAEEVIRSSAKRFRIIFENNPIPTWVFDLTTRQFLEVNNAAINHYGYSKEEFLAMSIKDLRPADATEGLNELLDAMNTRESKTAQGKHCRKDGTIIDVYISWNHMEYEGHSAVLVVAQDITDSLRANEELRLAKETAEIANKAKSEFLANMSHEIRTPMNGVIGTIGLLANTQLTDEQKEYIETIRLSGEALLNVIHDILDLSKIESNEIVLEEHPCRIGTCIEEAFDLFAIQADEKNIDLVYWIDDNVPQVVMIDITRLRQILVNLIGNAIKFTDHGEIYVHGSKASEKDGKIELHFSIRDTGIGIPSDRIHKLFRPFSQVDSSSTRKYGGSGLGLVICARAVALLDGRIWVVSKSGEGSTFNFTVKVSDTFIDPQEQNLLRPLVDKTKRALIINDNPMSRQILEDLLMDWGFIVQSVATLGDGLSSLRQHGSFDVVVAEQTPADYSGAHIKEEISRASGKANIGYIVLASRTKRDQIIRSNSELLQVVLKPVRHYLLYETLGNIVKQITGVPVSLPADHVPAEKPTTVPPMNILITEDNAINQKLIVRVLKLLGLEADIANTGLEAFEAVLRKKYDIVLMDIQMPEMDGYEATQRIRAEVSKENQPIIIAMTANALQGDEEKCLSVGMNDYMSKPILIDEVKRKMKKWYDVIHAQTS